MRGSKHNKAYFFVIYLQLKTCWGQRKLFPNKIFRKAWLLSLYYTGNSILRAAAERQFLPKKMGGKRMGLQYGRRGPLQGSLAVDGQKERFHVKNMYALQQYIYVSHEVHTRIDIYIDIVLQTKQRFHVKTTTTCSTGIPGRIMYDIYEYVLTTGLSLQQNARIHRNMHTGRTATDY